MSDRDWGRFNSELADKRAEQAKQNKETLPDIQHEKVSEEKEEDDKAVL